MDIRPIPSCPDYGASADGTIWRIVPPADARYSKRYPYPLRISATPNRKGYLCVHIHRTLLRYVHRLVLEAFVGPAPSAKHQARHLNGSNQDNRIENLCWGTAQENHDDQRRHGTLPLGSRVHNSILTEADAEWIRAYPKRPGAIMEMVRRLQVSRCSVTDALRGKSFRKY